MKSNEVCFEVRVVNNHRKVLASKKRFIELKPTGTITAKITSGNSTEKFMRDGDKFTIDYLVDIGCIVL